MDGSLMERANRLGSVLGQHGMDMIQALLILVVGLVFLNWLMRRFKMLLDKTMASRARAATILSSCYVFLVTVILAVVLVHLGIDGRNILRIVIIVSLVAIASIIILRPYIPTLPFKVGNTVKVGDLLGKIEATTLVHTRLRTFDGKTVFIPNEKILRDFVINYQITPTRRIKLDIPIRHIRDILKTKQLLETIMVEDPRVMKKPARPVVYTINLVDGCVMMGARCWVDNAKFWVAQCDLLEKMLIAMDREGIALAFRRQAVRLFHENALQVDRGGGAQDPTVPGSSHDAPHANAMSAVSTEDLDA